MSSTGPIDRSIWAIEYKVSLLMVTNSSAGRSERSGVAERVERSRRVGANAGIDVPDHLVEVEHQREAVDVGLLRELDDRFTYPVVHSGSLRRPRRKKGGRGKRRYNGVHPACMSAMGEREPGRESDTGVSPRRR